MKSTLLLFASVFVFAFTATAQDVSVDEIIDTYYENIGGKEAWREIKTMRIEGEGIQMGMKFPAIVLAKTPNKTKLTVDIQGMQMIEAFDGATAWATNPFAGQTEPAKKSEEETAEAAKNAFQDELLDYKEKGHTLTFEGSEEYLGTPVHKLKLVTKKGKTTTYYFDQELSVPIAMAQEMVSGPMKGKVIVTEMSDYQEVDGLMVAFSMTQKMDGQTFLEMVSNKVELNAPITDAEFEFPGN